jgi:hypothetical protein
MEVEGTFQNQFHQHVKLASPVVALKITPQSTPP